MRQSPSVASHIIWAATHPTSVPALLYRNAVFRDAQDTFATSTLIQCSS